MSRARKRIRAAGVSISQRKDGRLQASIPWRDEYGEAQRTFVYGHTVDEVVEKVEEARDRLRKGLPVVDSAATLASFTKTWTETTLAASDRKMSTKRLYRGLAASHIVGSRLGAMRLRALTPSHVERWLADLKASGRASSTVRQTYTVLRAILDTAVRDRLLALNPAAAIPRPRVERSESDSLTVEELRKLLNAAATTRYQPLFEFLAHTGMRRGEALALRWTDIDTRTRIMRINATLTRTNGELVRTSTKTAKSRREVPISPRVATILSEIQARRESERQIAEADWVETPYVFTTETGQPSEPRNALRALKTAARRAGLPTSIGLHTLRHTAASVMLEDGVPLKVVSDILGHTSVAITGDIYGHVTPKAVHDALARLGETIEKEHDLSTF